MDTWDISVEVQGQTYSALYWIEDDSVTVSTGLTSRRAQLGHSSPEAVARMLLREIVEQEILHLRA